LLSLSSTSVAANPSQLPSAVLETGGARCGVSDLGCHRHRTSDRRRVRTAILLTALGAVNERSCDAELRPKRHSVTAPEAQPMNTRAKTSPSSSILPSVPAREHAIRATSADVGDMCAAHEKDLTIQRDIEQSGHGTTHKGRLSARTHTCHAKVHDPLAGVCDGIGAHVNRTHGVETRSDIIRYRRHAPHSARSIRRRRKQRGVSVTVASMVDNEVQHLVRVTCEHCATSEFRTAPAPHRAVTGRREHAVSDCHCSPHGVCVSRAEHPSCGCVCHWWWVVIKPANAFACLCGSTVLPFACFPRLVSERLNGGHVDSRVVSAPAA
jgi:hypothetical protein